MKIYQKLVAGIALLVCLLSESVKASTFKPYEVSVNGITYRIDPRIEMFNTICMLFGHNGMTQSNISYKREVLERFFPYKQHPVVDSVLNTFKKGWSMDDPIFFMLCLDKDFKLTCDDYLKCLFTSRFSRQKISRSVAEIDKISSIDGLVKECRPAIGPNQHRYRNISAMGS